ncbi:MAG: hypothetical protein ACLQO1_25800 [Steroidobacteraceae bacterium]
MMRMKVSATTFGVALAALTANAVCPYTECDYTDPQYQADSKRWSDCSDFYVRQFTDAIERLAVLYPRFGIAYRARLDEDHATSNLDPAAAAAAWDENRRRFEDRILRTAETEALDTYNLMTLKVRREVEAKCGPIPEPPRKKP